MNILSSTSLSAALLSVWPLPRLAGCARAPAEAPAAAPIPVTVSYPVEREVTDYADFTARTAAVDSVEVRARVWGYLDKVNFKEGALVKKGDVLFEIDPRTYQAAAGPGRGQLVVQAEAQLRFKDRRFKQAPEAGRHGSRSAGKSLNKVAGRARRRRGHHWTPTRRPSGSAKLDLGVHQGHRADQRARQPVRW